MTLAWRWSTRNSPGTLRGIQLRSSSLHMACRKERPPSEKPTVVKPALEQPMRLKSRIFVHTMQPPFGTPKAWLLLPRVSNTFRERLAIARFGPQDPKISLEYV